MMTTLEAALRLTEKGFHVFPLIPNGKTPVERGKFKQVATNNSDQVKRLWRNEVFDDYFDYNVGVSTDLYLSDKALVVVDVDVKGDVNGLETLRKFKIEGRQLPKTYTVKTPSGGLHFYYWVEKAIPQGGAGVLGPGLDIRSGGGLVVGAGSVINGNYYTALDHSLSQCPDWIIEQRDRPEREDESQKPEIKEADVSRVLRYIHDVAPSAGIGNLKTTAYQVAARIKDFGASQDECLGYMEMWRNKKAPELQDDTLQFQVDSAYKYGKRPVGADAPEHDFKDEVQEESENTDPILKYNKRYAFALEGGNGVILHETSDVFGKFHLQRIKVNAFHDLHISDTYLDGEKVVQTSKAWFKHKQRRTFDRVVFQPGKEVSDNLYNLWKGFNVEPLETQEELPQTAKDAVSKFHDHIYENVCGKNNEYYDWVLSYFAHLIQNPSEKPLVALVLRGGKGVGKDTPINIVGHLIDRHYIMASDSRYFVGNFNAHLEHCLLIALNEAFWSGDKKAEGVLKHLITGDRHLIERKGQEVTVAKNYTRVVIIGNEEWLVPATLDERRFAVFDVGEGRKQDTEFFRTMRVGMEQGGYQALLRYLLDYEIKSDINIAPKTEALHEQIEKSLPPFEQWWLASLFEGTILGQVSHSETWPTEVGAKELRSAFYNYCREIGNRSRLIGPRVFGRLLQRYTNIERAKKREGESTLLVYQLPALSECRRMWDKIASKQTWPVEEEDELREVGL